MTLSTSLSAPSPAAVVFVRLVAIVQFLTGIALLAGGGWLISLGGSVYYAAAGLGFVASARFLWHRQITGVSIQLGLLMVTVLWALWEAGFNFWPQVPRLVLPVLLTALTLASVPTLIHTSVRMAKVWTRFAYVLVLVLVLFLLGVLVSAFQPHGIQRSGSPPEAFTGEGRSMGRTESG